MVLVTKYRNPVLMGEVRDLVYQIIRDVLSERGLNILEMNGDEDYVHVLFEVTHIRRRGALVNVVKTKTSRFARKQFGETELKKYYEKPLFWSDSYFITTISENSLETVQAYVRNQ
jgi:putative transposase